MRVYSRYISITYAKDLKVVKTQIQYRVRKNIINVKCCPKDTVNTVCITSWYPFRRLHTTFKYFEKDNISIVEDQFIVKHIPHIILSTKTDRGKSYIAISENNAPMKSRGSLYAISVIKTKQFKTFSDAIMLT